MADLGYQLHGYTPNYAGSLNGTPGECIGVGILAGEKWKVREVKGEYLDNRENGYLPSRESESHRPAVVLAELAGGLVIASMHLLWTDHGQDTEEQLSALLKLKVLLAKFEQRSMVLMGDANLDREKSLRSETLTSMGLADMTPREWISSIDMYQHRAGPWLRTMVDYVMMGDGVSVVTVDAVGGVSDHKAILAEVRL